MMKKINLIIIFCLISLPSFAFEDKWNNSSISILKGDNFSVGPDKSRTEFTYENAVGTAFGDSFFWMDVTSPVSKADGERTTAMYGEWSPRISLSRFIEGFRDDGWIKDIKQANTFEFGNNNFGQSRANLFGVGLDFNIPGFAFFQWNFYFRDNLDVPGVTTQSTIAYLMPLNINDNWKFKWNAYIDIVHGDEGNSVNSNYVDSHYHTAQQFMWDTGALIKSLPGLNMGLEYQLWENKYGIVDGESEYNLKYMIQLVL